MDAEASSISRQIAAMARKRLGRVQRGGKIICDFQLSCEMEYTRKRIGNVVSINFGFRESKE